MKKVALIVGAAAVVLAGGGYALYDYYAGNHVEVKQVISSSVSSSESNGSSGQVEAEVLNGTWQVQPESEVYFSVTTSKETVNFVVPDVTGSWLFNLEDPSKMSAQGTADLNKLDSGNGQRDSHIKGSDYLTVGEFPEAKFTVSSFEQVPTEWQEGVAVPLKLSGTLEVKGITKDVIFESDAMYEQDQLKLQGKSTVTFEDFGLKNPHTVMLDTENNVTLQLSLVFKK